MTAKTPEEKAEEWIRERERKGNWLAPEAMGPGYSITYKDAFLAGRTAFIRDELPKLLEMAREKKLNGHPQIDGYVLKFSIADLLALAEKGEG